MVTKQRQPDRQTDRQRQIKTETKTARSRTRIVFLREKNRERGKGGVQPAKRVPKVRSGTVFCRIALSGVLKVAERSLVDLARIPVPAVSAGAGPGRTEPFARSGLTPLKAPAQLPIIFLRRGRFAGRDLGHAPEGARVRVVVRVAAIA